MRPTQSAAARVRIPRTTSVQTATRPATSRSGTPCAAPDSSGSVRRPSSFANIRARFPARAAAETLAGEWEVSGAVSGGGERFANRDRC